MASYASRAEARERSAVLLSKGLAHWTREQGHRFHLWVEPEVADEATVQLAAYDREAAEVAARPPVRALPLHSPGWKAPLLVTVVLCTMFALQQKTDDRLTEWGLRDSQLILDHWQWWRPFTALLLHADLGHLAGNLVFGGVFSWFVCRAAGPWLGWGLIALAGTLGNILSAVVMHPEPFRGIGASTAVFGAVGLLVMQGVRHTRHEHGLRSHRAWLVPLGAGMALLGMFGSGGEKAGVDLAAHLFGFVGGLVVGGSWWSLTVRPA